MSSGVVKMTQTNWLQLLKSVKYPISSLDLAVFIQKSDNYCYQKLKLYQSEGYLFSTKCGKKTLFGPTEKLVKEWFYD
jgi:hypothetical protein